MILLIWLLILSVKFRTFSSTGSVRMARVVKMWTLWFMEELFEGVRWNKWPKRWSQLKILKHQDVFIMFFLSKSKFLVNLLSVSRFVGLGLLTRDFFKLIFRAWYKPNVVHLTNSDFGVSGFGLNLNLKLIDFYCLQRSANHDVRSLFIAITSFSLDMNTNCHANLVVFFNHWESTIEKGGE